MAKPTESKSANRAEADVLLEQLFKLVDAPRDRNWDSDVCIFLEERMAPIIHKLGNARDRMWQVKRGRPRKV